MSKDELIKQLDFKLSMIDELQVTDKQRLSIAKHIAKIPKVARIEFINALLLIHHKAGNYDHFAHLDQWEEGDSCYDPSEDRDYIIFTNAEWNK